MEPDLRVEALVIADTARRLYRAWPSLRLWARCDPWGLCIWCLCSSERDRERHRAARNLWQAVREAIGDEPGADPA